jgi:hypothetical protein
MLAQVKGVLGNAFKKMSQRAIWRGDRGQSQMLESHGMAGMRSNLLNDTPTYKKEVFSLSPSIKSNNMGVNKNSRNTNGSTKAINTQASSNATQNKGLGSSILNSL